jgi:hypothetical protein
VAAVAVGHRDGSLSYFTKKGGPPRRILSLKVAQQDGNKATLRLRLRLRGRILSQQLELVEGRRLREPVQKNKTRTTVEPQRRRANQVAGEKKCPF